MYMAPITRAAPAPVAPALHRAVGAPVLTLAALVTLPWLLFNAVAAGLVVAGRFAVQAMDYAGQIAVGR